MVRKVKDLGIDQWSADDRFALAQELWDSLADDLPPPSLTPEQCRELDRRDADMDADPGVGMTWEEVVASIKGRR